MQGGAANKRGDKQEQHVEESGDGEGTWRNSLTRGPDSHHNKDFNALTTNIRNK